MIDDDATPSGPLDDLRLIGHDAAEGVFLDAVASERTAHAWLLTGPPGIGKATLARRMATRVLAGADGQSALFEAPAASWQPSPSDPATIRVAHGTHPDLMIVSRVAEEEGGRVPKEIGVAAIRRVGAFLRLTPAEGGWRAVIVDSADDMNRNAANALLKVLEEPPHNVLLVLVSHAPHGLLPTIRSRCRRLALSPLSDEDTRAVLASRVADAADDDLALATRLAEGCPGRGIDLLRDDALAIFRDVCSRLDALPRIDVRAIDALGDAVARAKEDRPFHRVFDAVEWWLSETIRGAAAGATAPPPAAPGGLEQWLEVWDKINRLHRRTESANLDRKQAVISAFNLLEAAARP
jgi:DNA polymerase-3 subunit delta'